MLGVVPNVPAKRTGMLIQVVFPLVIAAIVIFFLRNYLLNAGRIAANPNRYSIIVATSIALIGYVSLKIALIFITTAFEGGPYLLSIIGATFNAFSGFVMFPINVVGSFKWLSEILPRGGSQFWLTCGFLWFCIIRTLAHFVRLRWIKKQKSKLTNSKPPIS